MYVKLFGSILDSSIWAAEPETRIVWITMLAMADEVGVVSASVGGLAYRARISLRACRRALRLLLNPDPDSRDRTDGRRIEEVQGGWLVLNYAAYRELRTKRQVMDAARQARHRQQRSVTPRDRAVTPRDAPLAARDRGSVTTEAEAEAYAEAETKEVLSAPDGAATGGSPPQVKVKGAPRKDTWLTPFGDAWKLAYGGEPAYGELGKHLKPLLEGRDLGEVLEHWGRYLEATEAQYVSPARFAQTYGKWGKPPRPSKDHVPDMYLTLEEQAERRAKRAGKSPEKEGPVHIGEVVAQVVPKP